MRAALVQSNSDSNFGTAFAGVTSPDVQVQLMSPRIMKQPTVEEMIQSSLNAATSSPVRSTVQQNSWVMETPGGLLDSSESSNKEGMENSSGSFADSETEFYGGMDSVQNTIFEMVILDLIPVEAVDSPRFKSLIRKGTRKAVSVPCSADIVGLILKTHSMMQGVCASEIAKADHKCVKLEFWKNMESSYLTISVQALFENWKTRQYVVKTKELSEEFVTKDMVEEIEERNLGFGLENCVILSENSAILNELKQKQTGVCLMALCKTVEDCGQYITQNPACKAILNKVQNVVKFFNSNNVAKNVLNEKQVLCTLPVNCLTNSNIRSWQSCLEMLETIMLQHNAITCSFLDQRLEMFTHMYKLETTDYVLIKRLISILSPLKTASRLGMDMRYPTAAVILPALKKLEVSLLQNGQEKDKFADIRGEIVEMLKCNYENPDVKQFLLQCSLLDPRFKGLKFVSQSDQDIAYEQLKQSAVKIKNQSSERYITESSPESSPRKLRVKVEVDEDASDQQEAVFDIYLKNGAESTSDTENSQSSKRQKMMPKSSKSATDDWFADVTMEIKDGAPDENGVASEISRYKAEIQISSAASPLSWWRDREKSFPLLSTVAKQYMFVPAMLGNRDEVTEKWYQRQRSCIPSHLVEPITFLHANYHKLKKVREDY